MVIFPDNPVDGQQLFDPAPDGSSITVWTYNAANNEWTFQVYTDLIEGKVIYTNQVLTVPRDEGTAAYGEPPGTYLNTQEDVNTFIADVSNRAIKATGRAADSVDFLQNSVGKGIWVRTDDSEGRGYPGLTEFWANAQNFKDVTNFKFNDTGAPGFTSPGTLEDTRIGDYLVVQQNDDNHFGMYVITGQEVERTDDDNIIRTMEVKLYRGQRAFGDAEHLSHCTVTTSRPMAVVVQDDQPIVSTRGVLWYREKDDHLFISNYADGFTGTGPQWTDLTEGAGGGGGGVTVGEDPPDPAEEGDQWFDTSRLELFLYIPDADGVLAWVPCSPLGARVAAGEEKQRQIETTLSGHGNALDDLYSTQADLLNGKGSNDVTTSFRIKSGGNTLVSASGNKLGLYNLSEPTNASHAATAGYVDNHIGPTWKWIVDGSNLASQRQAIRWYTSDDITMNLYVHGLTLTGNDYDFYSGPRSSGDDPRELMSIYGLNPEGKMKHILIAPVRNWEFGGGFCAFRCNVADMRIWDPTGLENETPVHFKFGALF